MIEREGEYTPSLSRPEYSESNPLLPERTQTWLEGLTDETIATLTYDDIPRIFADLKQEYGEFSTHAKVRIDMDKMIQLRLAGLSNEAIYEADVGAGSIISVQIAISRFRQTVYKKRNGSGDDMFEQPLPILGAGGSAEPSDWRADALCAKVDPEQFFPEKGGSASDAKKLCAKCGSQVECLVYAMRNSQTFGIWGGKSTREISEIKRTLVKRDGLTYEDAALSALGRIQPLHTAEESVA